MKKPYFSKEKYIKWMLENNKEEEALLNYFNNDFFNQIDGKNIEICYYTKEMFNSFGITHDKIDILTEWGLDEVFMFPIFTDFSEVIDSHIIRPEWVEWK
jgi:hypothetical protein